MDRRTRKEFAFSLIELAVVVATAALLAAVLLPARAATRADIARLYCVNNLKQVGLAFRTWADAHQSRYPMRVADAEGGCATVINATQPQNTWRFFQVLSNELNTPKVVVCPTDERNPRTNFLNISSGSTQRDFYDNTAVSYFVGIDATDERPRMFLSGDRNIGTGPGNPSAYGYSPNAPSVAGAAISFGTNTVTGTGALLQWTIRMHERQGNIVLADGSVQQYSSVRLREALRTTGDNSMPKGVTISPGGNNFFLP